MEFETVIGLEVHAQLKTESKIFCSCSTRFGSEPNENTCPICLGMPGVLPVLNAKAVEYALRACLATHCEVEPTNVFDRKNYFYPDLPKGYQISQFTLPIGRHGRIKLQGNGTPKIIGITRIHMEEDAGKSIHGENLGNPGKSYVDFNRTGVPLVEIVSEPEIRSAEEAREYLMILRSILEYSGVSDCNMEEGSFRCDANVSIRPVGEKELGTRAEVKNINSFKFVQKAIEYEVKRQAQVLKQGDRVVQETRLYDAERGVTFSMRSKEEAHDYRYFPEPDLAPIVIDEEWIKRAREALPELPEEKSQRFVTEYGIPEYDAGVLTASRELADYFEACIRAFNQPKAISNWIMSELLRELKNADKDITECPVSPENLAKLLSMVHDNTISGKIAKTVFEDMIQSGKSPEIVVKEKNLVQISDEGAIESLIDEVISANPDQAEQYRSGKDKVIGFLVGQVMKASKGKANPGLVNKMFQQKLRG
ncbi:MAG: Asp-tRNA(Asn)/Glu-tRNA(Gln) amidotransferase subunit GatB [Candidatus Nitronauta litoralis]|uniref:Aspartyl/glutamyl-tRNA(Asn/Gln) amidotransferase subunit B n=1 Tax=Candidatus Nitronauta litoralis TaxID=2705533 RepID=A0A7T0BX93_9BACT|nr:MAG: Asp-tRNA(Asn)/Glu-tRNA(Gln) amidotransferase subunit GatB [Candidatus Nitronauta litoralis]